MPIENAPGKNNTKIILGMELQIKEKDKNLIGKMFRKDKRCLLTLDFKPFRSQVKAESATGGVLKKGIQRKTPVWSFSLKACNVIKK